MKNRKFHCGTCNLYEEGLSDKEVLQLSYEHSFLDNHIDRYELRKKLERLKIKERLRRERLI